MASEIVSFRFTASEIEALKAHGAPDEKPGTIAQRLLRQALGLPTNGNDAGLSANEVSRLIEAKLQPLQEQMQVLIEALREKKVA